jgi:hypothetical protein
MQNEFCVVLDWRYLPRGLVLYRSLARCCETFRLRVLCMDSQTEHALRRLALKGLTVIPLAELERQDPELLGTKASRSQAEYCWTAVPPLCLFLLEREPDLEGITYLDAELEFYADPGPLFEELGDGCVLITPHRHAPEFRAPTRRDGSRDEPGGTYNAQFVSFRRDPDGLAALAWWRQRCLEWCYRRVEPGRFGKQKYLEELELRFPRVRVSRNIGAGVAPWNVSQYTVARFGDALRVDGLPVIFHHFQSLEVHPATHSARTVAGLSRAYRLADGPVPLVWTAGWRLSESVLSTLWDPYLERLSRTFADAMGALGTAAVPAPGMSASHTAFQIARRHTSVRLRDAYWRAVRRRDAHRGG